MRWTGLRAGLALMLMASPALAPAPAPAPASAPPGPAAKAETPPPLPPREAPTYAENDVLGAAEGVFGKGAEGLAELVRSTFSKYGEPNAYIVGKEAGGAIVVGLRYGSGKLYHKVEGEQVVHWTGPSIGFDLGGDGSKTFALVYNLNDTEDLFRRYPAAEGK
ncbi:MAG: EipA family protein, partial [Polymorphobacter sp.]